MAPTPFSYLMASSSCMALVLALAACKKINSKPQQPVENQVAAASPDRPLFSGLSKDALSEEPSGQGQPTLNCSWQQPPSSSEPTAKISCTLVDAQGQEMRGVRVQQWQIDSYASDVKVFKSEHEHQVYLTFSGPSRDAVFAAVFDMQLVFKSNQPVNLELRASGRDLIKGPPGGQKVASSCGQLFELLLIDEYGMATFSQMRSFPSCERLAASLMNRSFPDAAVTNLPARSKLLKASCAEAILRLDYQQPPQQLTHSAISPGVCQDLASFINAQGL